METSVDHGRKKWPEALIVGDKYQDKLIHNGCPLEECIILKRAEFDGIAIDQIPSKSATSTTMPAFLPPRIHCAEKRLSPGVG